MRPRIMTLLATERVLDLRMAGQAVRHLRQVGFRHLVGFLQTAMTRGAVVAGTTQLSADPVSR
jgi:hypothetical protein